MSEDEKALVVELAELLYTDEELAEKLGIEVGRFMVLMEDKAGDMYRAVARGRSLTDARHRRAVIDLDQRGSSPAQAMVDGWLKRIAT